MDIEKLSWNSSITCSSYYTQLYANASFGINTTLCAHLVVSFTVSTPIGATLELNPIKTEDIFSIELPDNFGKLSARNTWTEVSEASAAPKSLKLCFTHNRMNCAMVFANGLSFTRSQSIEFTKGMQLNVGASYNDLTLLNLLGMEISELAEYEFDLRTFKFRRV